MRRVPELAPDIVCNLLKNEGVVTCQRNWTERRLEDRAEQQLSAYVDYQKIHRDFKVSEKEGGFKFLEWRDTSEEVMLDVSGLLVCFNLPPITKWNRVNARIASSMLHSVIIVGPDNKEFQSAILALKLIHRYFDESCRLGQLRPLAPHHFGDLDAIAAETRFVTPKKRCVFASVSIPEALDPQGILQDLVAQGEFQYTEDNIVTFKEVNCGDKEGPQKKTVQPQCFHVGQLVEVTLSFRVVAIGDKYVPLIRFESLLLVNRVGSDIIATEHESMLEDLRSTSTPLPVIERKRRVSSDEDDLTLKRLRQAMRGSSSAENETRVTEDELL